MQVSTASTQRDSTLTRYESAIHELAERLQGVDASLTTSIAEILTVALQELIEAELTATIGADHRNQLAALAEAGQMPVRATQEDGRLSDGPEPSEQRGQGSVSGALGTASANGVGVHAGDREQVSAADT